MKIGEICRQKGLIVFLSSMAASQTPAAIYQSPSVSAFRGVFSDQPQLNLNDGYIS